MSAAASVTEINLEESVATPGTRAPLLPIMGVVFVAFLVIGMAMPVLPLHVHNALGLVRLRLALSPAAFLDLAQGLASPALGLIALRLNVVFFASAISVLCAALVASWLVAHPPTMEGSP